MAEKNTVKYIAYIKITIDYGDRRRCNKLKQKYGTVHYNVKLSNHTNKTWQHMLTEEKP
jgi:hypothetical protein